MILIIAESDDTHAACVVQEAKRRGEHSMIVDFKDFGRSLYLTDAISEGVRLRDAKIGVSFHSSEAEAVWLRRPGRVDIRRMVNAPHREFAMGEWREAVLGWLQQLDPICVNPVRAQDKAVKPAQLAAAHAVGLDVPATLVSNDRHDVARFVAQIEGQAIHKTLSQPKKRLFDTRPWTAADDHLVESISVAPVLVQERVSGPADLRLTVIGDTIMAARIETPGEIVDSRLADETAYRSHILDAVTEKRIIALFKRLGLVFGTVDLKERSDGTPVFLEINPQGQFLYIQIVTGLPIIETLTDFLLRRRNS
jgi:glutathione synthase/RimK-type ligase-like ATP-grasp enzyme